MELLYKNKVKTSYGEKEISVEYGDITTLDYNVDVLTISAFKNEYSPTIGTIYHSLKQVGIDVISLAEDKFYDLKDNCNVWLSKALNKKKIPVTRIGVIEMEYDINFDLVEDKMLKSIKAYFKLLDIASTMDMEVETIALPMLGTGSQDISSSLIVIPVLTECINFLKRNEHVKRICLFDINKLKADLFVNMLKKLYLNNNFDINVVSKVPNAFISYSSLDTDVADKISSYFKGANIDVWYANKSLKPGDIFAEEIYKAINNSTHFVVIISEHSIYSSHVLNEIALASDNELHDLKIIVLFIQDVELPPSFVYYLKRQQWKKIYIPPMDKRLDEVAESIIKDQK